jgi:hypothetical protein
MIATTSWAVDAGLFGLIQCLKLFTAAFATEMGTG